MGSFLTAVSQEQISRPEKKFFTRYTLSKLRQYHALYKTMCDTLSIDDSQFAQIFGDNQEVFELLDSDYNLLIDGLQLFAGLILFSDSKFQDKLTFLFDIFDFNQLKSLSNTDLEFLLLSCCTVSHKVLGLKSSINEQIIRDIICEYFPTDKRINISDLLRWASNMDYIKSFFYMIEKPIPQPKTLTSMKIYHQTSNNQLVTPIYNRSKHPKDNDITKWTGSLVSKLAGKPNSHLEYLRGSDIAIDIEWVYGIRCLDIKQSIELTFVGGKEAIVYVTGCLVVIFFVNFSKQLHYEKHKNEIISLVTYGSMAATGELASYPEIHVWNLETRETLKIFKGHLRDGIYQLKFSSNGEYLYASGLGNSPALFVYSVQKQQIVHSTFHNYPIVEICNICSYISEQDSCVQMIISNTREVYCAHIDNNKEICLLFGVGSLSNITTTAALKYYKKNRYLRKYRDANESVCAILTGHEKGELVLWQQAEQHYVKTLIKPYSYEVCRIKPLEDSIVVACFCCYIDIWSLELKLLKTVDITSINISCFNYEIVNVAGMGRDIVMVTQEGDVIKMVNEKYRKLNVIKMKGEQSCCSLLQKQQKIIYVGSKQGLIYGIDMKNKNIMDVWRLGEPISAIDAVSTMLVAGTTQGRVHMRVNFEEVQKSFSCQKAINDLKIVKSNTTLVVACEDRSIYGISYGSKYQFVKTRKLDMDNSIPKSLFLLENKVIFSTTDNKLYMLSMNDFKYKLLEDREHLLDTNFISLKYTSDRAECLPVICFPKLIAFGSTLGGLVQSVDKQTLKQKNKDFMCHHRSILSGILCSSDNRDLVTVGKNDNTVIQYRARLTGQNKFLSLPEGQMTQQAVEDESIQRENRYCLYSNNSLSVEHDQHILVRGIRNPTLSKLLHGMLEQWKENSRSSDKNTPPVSLHLNYVYGIETFERRDSVMYLENPKRFVWYVSNIVVIYNPSSNQQQFYRGHRQKVTCINKINSQLTCSAEASYSPSIHIWNHNTLKTDKIIQTGHRWGICQIASLNNHILSYGIEDKVTRNEYKDALTFSIQMTNINDGSTVGFKKQGIRPVYSMLLNPSNNNEFVTVGQNSVTFWHCYSQNIRKSSICSTNDEIVTACIPLIYMIGKKKHLDIVVGTRGGNLCLVILQKQCIIMKEKAHLKRINCLRWLNSKMDLFISSGEDQFLKVWNRKYESVYEIQMKKIDFFKEISKVNSDNKYFQKTHLQKNLSVQSISVLNDNQILLATRNGQVMEMTVQNSQFSDIKYSLFLRNHCAQSTLSQQHRRVYFVLHPIFDIMFSLGEDQNLFLWDTEKNKIITSKMLGYIAFPTAMKFNKDGDILVIGFSDGLVIFLDSKIIKSNQGKNDDKYIIPTLTLVQKHKQQKKAAVLSMQFSESGEHLAISYNSCFSQRIKYDPAAKSEPSCISLFIIRTKEKTKTMGRMNQPDKVYSWFTDVRCQQGQKTYHTEHGNIYGVASYFMQFAECEGKTYLLIYYQLVDSNNIRLNHISQSDYIVWDVNTSTIVINMDLLSKITWKRLNFPNSINCKYQLYNRQIQGSIEKLDNKPKNNNFLKPEITSMLNMNYKNSSDSESGYLILGSLNGDVHLVQARCLEYGTMNDNPPDSEMYLGRSYAAHNSFVDNMESSPAHNDSGQLFLYTSGLEDQCLMKWKIEYEPNEASIKHGPDIFGEMPAESHFEASLEMWKRRQEVSTIRNRKDGLYKCHNKKPLRQHFIIGRKKGKNNLFFDCHKEAVYTSGQNICLMNLETNKQIVLNYAEKSVTCGQDISSLALSRNRRLLATGTASLSSKILIWQIRSNSCIKTLKLQDACLIEKLEFSDDNTKLLVLSVDKHFVSSLHLVDIERQCVIGTAKMVYYPPWIIKNFCFLPGTFEHFITCGIAHFRTWTLVSNELTYRNIALKQEQEKSDIILFAAISLHLGYVVCCDEGKLYHLDTTNKLVTVTKAHEGMCVALSRCSNNRFVSGGRDGKVALWTINNKEFELLSEFSVKPQASLKSLNAGQKTTAIQIDSVDLEGDSILVGTVNGSIFTSKLDSQTKCLQEVMSQHCQQAPVGMFFTSNDTELYEITASGLLSIWNLNELKRVQWYNFGRNTSNMLLAQNQQVFFIVLENQIVAYRKGDPTFTEIEGFMIRFKCKIISVAVSSNEKMMAVAVEKSSDSKARICIYDINTAKSFQLLYQTFLVKNPDFVDFSTTNKVVLCKLNDKDVYVDTMNWSNAVSQGRKHEWIGKGLRDSPRLSSIVKMYNEEKNSLLNVVQLFQDFYVCTDTFGTVRVFYKDQDKEASAQFIFSSFSHLNSITMCVRSKKQQFLATSSEIDKSIIVWRIDKNYK